MAKAGRPKLAPADRKSVGVSLRLKPEVRDVLKREAEARGNTLTGEITERINNAAAASLASERSDFHAYGSPRVRALMHLIGMTVRNFEAFGDDTLWDDPVEYETMMEAVTTILAAFHPEAEPVSRDVPVAESRGARKARGMLRQLKRHRRYRKRSRTESLDARGDFIPLIEDEYLWAEIWRDLGSIGERLSGPASEGSTASGAR